MSYANITTSAAILDVPVCWLGLGGIVRTPIIHGDALGTYSLFEKLSVIGIYICLCFQVHEVLQQADLLGGLA